MSLKQIFEEHPERRYIMFGGKGGLGKTTFSAATAYWLAQQGKKVLVFSVDPQASLSDIFQKDIFGKGPVKIMENLWAQEIDADQHIKAYQNEIRQKILDMYGFDEVPEEIEQYIQAASAEPAMEESAIFDAVVDIVVEGDYDYYIYDLVPLGHALYYLSMAKVYDEWINKITKLREEMREYEEMVSRMKREKETEEDQILTELQYIRSRINASSQHPDRQGKDRLLLCRHPGRNDPDRHAKAAELFAKFDVPIMGYVVNRWCRGNCSSRTSRLPEEPHRDAGQVPGADRDDVRRTGGGPRSGAGTRRDRPGDDRAAGRNHVREIGGEAAMNADRNLHAGLRQGASSPALHLLWRQGRRGQDRRWPARRPSGWRSRASASCWPPPIRSTA